MNNTTTIGLGASLRFEDEARVTHHGHPAPKGTTNLCIGGQVGAERKEQVRLAAHLALKVYSLHELARSGLLVAKRDRTAHYCNRRAVAGFLRRIGGAR